MSDIGLLLFRHPGYHGVEGESYSTIPVVDHREAFVTDYPDDRWFAPYVLIGDDVPPGQSLRLNKSSLPTLKRLGYKVACNLVVLDFDHNAPDVTKLPPEWGWYSTQRGIRLFAELSTPIGPLHAEAQIRAAFEQFPGADPKCKDWTRLFRLPRVVRCDSKTGDRPLKLEGLVVFPARTLDPIPEPAHVPERRRVRVAFDPDDVQFGFDAEQRIERARIWLDSEAPIAIAGQNGDDVTWQVAQRVARGYALSQEQTSALLLEWNRRCEPPWDKARIEYKVGQAIECGTLPWGVCYWEPPGKVKERELTPPPDDPYRAAEVEAERKKLPALSDLQTEAFLTQQLQTEMGPVAALDGKLYRRQDDAWKTVSEREMREWLDTWDGRSPDPTRFKSMSFSFNTVKGLLKGIPARLEREEEGEHALYYTPTEAVTLTGVESCQPPVGITTLPAKWDDNASCPRFESFLARVLPVEEMREFVIDFVGACLLGRGVEAQTVVCFEGVGQNGKGVLTNLINRLFSPRHRTSIAPTKMNDETRLWSLKRARINIVGDLSTQTISDTAGFKQVVAGDPVMVKNLYADVEVVRPVAGHLFATNLPPTANDESSAFVRRWLVVYFGVRIPDNEVVQDLEGKIWKEEAIGIARLFREGARRVSVRGLKIPDACRQEMREWIADDDPVRRAVAFALEKVGDSFSGQSVTDMVNVALSKEGMPRTSSKVLARYYRLHGFRSKHTATGSTWTRRPQ